MNRNYLLLPLAACLLGLVGCESTYIESSWKKPDLVTLQFEKVLIIAATPQETVRRKAEDLLMARIEADVEIVPSYELIPDQKGLADRDAVAATAEAAGIDGVVVMRPIGRDTEVSVTPGGYYVEPYSTWDRYYTRRWGLSYYNSYSVRYREQEIITDTIYGIETSIFDLRTRELQWTAISRSKNPDNLANLVDEVVGTIGKELRAEGLIAKTGE